MPRAAVKTKQIFDPKLEPDVLAEEIVKISQAFNVLKSSRLKESTILLLLHHSSGLSQRDCKKVVEACCALSRTYLK